MKRMQGKRAATGRARQYTIRGVPSDIDRRLRERARRAGVSLNEVLLQALRKGLDALAADQPITDIEQVCGTWVDDPEFDKTMEEFGRIDESFWK